MEPPGSCWWAFLSLSVRSKCDPLYVMMTPISIISEFERHLLSAFKHPLPWELCDQCVLKNISLFPEQKSFLDLEWKAESSALFFSCQSLARHSMRILWWPEFVKWLQPKYMEWDLILYSSAICSPFGSRCCARSSSLAHPLLPGHVVGRRDDDVVPALENVDVDICKTKF